MNIAQWWDMLLSWFTPTVIDVLIAMIKTVVILLTTVLGSAIIIMIERRLLGLWQGRYGPNRVGWQGVLQLPADMLKMFFKEDWTPPFVDKLTFWIAPMVAMSALLTAMIIVPITPTWGIANLDIGVLFFLAMAGLGVYAVMLAGWASNSKYALLGGVRSAAQTVTYEVFMGVSVMGVVAMTGSFNLREIVMAQQDCWFIVPQFLGFITFALAGVAVAHRSPFDLPEAEQELAAGYQTEYSGLKWGMFYVGEYVSMVVVSALIVTLFCGGWLGPGPEWLAIFWFIAKVMTFVVLMILMRAAMPRPRYDQLMDMGWKFCLPLTLLNLLGTGAYILYTGTP